MLDSHDTTRILWTLTPAADDDAAKSDPVARALGLQAVRLASALQLTMPGMASVYYGDEVGLSGQDDPDDRRPYPWGAEDAELLAWYTRLAGLRQDRSALRDGDLAFLGAEDAVGALAYLRRSDDDAALIAVNVGEEPWTLDLDVAGRLPEGLMLDDALADLTGGPADPAPVTVVDGRVRVRIPARGVRVLMPEGAADLTPPPAPARPHAETAPGRVALAWEPVADATRYQVWRSPVSGGGYVLVGDATEPAFVDAGVANGALAHHVVTALDAAGNVSARSGEVASLPRVTIAAVVATGEQGREAPVRLTGPAVPVTGIVTLDGGASTDPASGIRAQVGLGPAGTDPAGAGWVWTDAAPDVVAADRWVGGVRPEEAGTFATAVRASSDGGRTWTLSGVDRTLVMLPDPDPSAPRSPIGLTVLDAAADHVTLGWEPADPGRTVRYVVLRGANGADPMPVGTSADPLFTDLEVVPGTRYLYRVAAQDDGADTSPPSEPVAAVAEERSATVNFRVTVPADTPPDAQLFIAGDFQGWAPGDTPMTQVDATTWSIELPFKAGTAIQYKYTRGSWESVEKDEACGEIPNRTLTADASSGTEQLVEDVVGKWRDIDACP